ncbi:hypothetical protein EVAR_100317_1 [Eumeta japonica]|uniref:Uncharacterized protein n=1 Tax=Eumeta variegata TaxID=151549 RepID=A0A4C1ZSQ8_EUMVA|nr:hypothetical protein EVAR_100317_1 [Eumeta japonica]
MSLVTHVRYTISVCPPPKTSFSLDSYDVWSWTTIVVRDPDQFNRFSSGWPIVHPSWSLLEDISPRRFVSYPQPLRLTNSISGIRRPSCHSKVSDFQDTNSKRTLLRGHLQETSNAYLPPGRSSESSNELDDSAVFAGLVR